MASSVDQRGFPDAALIPQFYAGREVLITGATGFIGQVLTERLLSTCTNIRLLHLLVRIKEGESLETKRNKITELKLFDVLRENKPEQLNKLNLIPGDITKTNLGLDEKSIAELNNVSVVFHLAATIKFNEELELAVKMNTLAPMSLLDICDQLPKMAALVHVSTAYCHTERALVEETVYPPAPAPARPLHHLIQDSLSGRRMTKDELERFLSPKINTYTFTKSLAESAVTLHGNRGYPIAIFRPTLVTAALRNPFPGWVQGYTGAIAVFVNISLGLMRVLGCRKESPIDLIPVDIVADTLIAAAWETALDNDQEVRVYNCCAMEEPIAYRDVLRYTVEAAREDPSPSIMWYPFVILVSNRYLMHMLEFILEVIPLHLAEYTMKLFGKKGKRLNLMSACKLQANIRSVTHTFALCDIRFRAARVRRLRARLAPADAELYFTDPASINWRLYFKDFIKGIRLHIIKDKEEDNSAARKRLFKLLCAHTAVSLSLLLLLAWLLMRVAGSIAGIP